MATQETTVYKSKVIGPRLRTLVGHPWGWVAVGDLMEVLNQDATTVWFQYCHDAREAIQSEDWNGRSWTVAIPDDDGYVVRNVWDNKTGNLISTASFAPEDLLVPAGWYKNRNKVADQLDEAIRAFFVYFRDHGGLSLHDCGHCNTIAQANQPELEKALATIGTVSQLEWALARIVSYPGGLEMTRADDENENTIRLKFKNPSVSAFMVLTIRLRTVIGEIKLQQLSVWDM